MERTVHIFLRIIHIGLKIVQRLQDQVPETKFFFGHKVRLVKGAVFGLPDRVDWLALNHRQVSRCVPTLVLYIQTEPEVSHKLQD